jgi:flagellar biosynthesis/type III secretory pathway chaperone
MDPATIWSDLIGQFQRELEYLEAEEAVLSRERRSLTNRDLDGILDCIKEKETLRVQGRILGESRRRLRDRLREIVQTHAGQNLLEAAVQQAEQSVRVRLLDLRQRLAERFKKIERLTEGNRYLIQAALGHLSRSVAFLGQFQDGQTYCGDGRVRWQDGPRSRIQHQA